MKRLSFFRRNAGGDAGGSEHFQIEFWDRVFMMLLYDSGVWAQDVLDIKLQDLRITGDNRYVVFTG